MRLLILISCLAMLPAFGFQGSGPYPSKGPSLPVPTYKVPLQYTPDERAAKIEGEVWITTLVDEKGIPTELKVARSLNEKLDQQALAAVAQWRFKPGMKEGAPVAVKATITVSFRLNDPTVK